MEGRVVPLAEKWRRTARDGFRKVEDAAVNQSITLCSTEGGGVGCSM